MLILMIRFTTVVLFYSLMASFPFDAQAQSNQTYFDEQRIEKIENYIRQGMADERIPGISVALTESDKVVYLEGFGIADDDATPVTPQTPFQLASMTKSFVALLILQIELEGKLSLSDRVVDHIPWFTTANKSQSDRITIRNLLQHNSGFSTSTGNLNQNTTYRGADATRLLVKQLSRTTLSSEPNTKFEYSNSNYQILSHIVEAVEGKPFEKVMSERILQPLGMQNSYVQISGAEMEKAATGFPQWFGYPIERPFIPGRMKMADGGLVASAEDLTKYLLEVAHGQIGLVSKQMRDNLLSSEQNNSVDYALGWEIDIDKQGHRLYKHGGLNGGFNSLFGFSDSNELRSDISFVILSNYSSALHDQFVRNLSRTILGYEPLPNRPNMINLVSLVIMLVSILLLVLALYRAIKNQSTNNISTKSFVIPAMLLIFSYIMAYVVPAMNKINLLSIYPFFPDLAVGLIACAALSLVVAAILILKRLRFLLSEK